MTGLVISSGFDQDSWSSFGRFPVPVEVRLRDVPPVKHSVVHRLCPESVESPNNPVPIPTRALSVETWKEVSTTTPEVIKFPSSTSPSSRPHLCRNLGVLFSSVTT